MGWRASVAAAALLLCVGLRAAEVAEDLVSINVQDAKLSEICVMLSRAASVNVVAASDVKDRRMSLALTNVPLTDVLEVIAETNALEVRKTGSTLILTRPRSQPSAPPWAREPWPPTAPRPPWAYDNAGPHLAPTDSPPAMTRPGQPLTPLLTRAIGPSVRRTIRLRYAVPSRIAALFGQRSVEITKEGRTSWLAAEPQRPAGAINLGDATYRALPEDLDRAAEPLVAPVPPTWPAPLELPDGISALVGCDLLSALIVVGEPAAIDELTELVGKLDQPPQPCSCAVSLALLPASTARASGLFPNLVGSRQTALRAAVGDYHGLLRGLADDPQVKLWTLPEFELNTADPRYIEFSRRAPLRPSPAGARPVLATVRTRLTLYTAVFVRAGARTLVLAGSVSSSDNLPRGNVFITAWSPLTTQVAVPAGQSVCFGGVDLYVPPNATVDPVGSVPFLNGAVPRDAAGLALWVFVTPRLVTQGGDVPAR